MKRLKAILSASGLVVLALSLPSWAQLTRSLPTQTVTVSVSRSWGALPDDIGRHLARPHRPLSNASQKRGSLLCNFPNFCIVVEKPTV